MLDPEVSNKLLQMTNQKHYAITKTAYYQIMRELLNIFGSLYYTDANDELVKVKCVNGRQERMVGRDKKDTTLVLPLISITEANAVVDTQRSRYNPVLINEKIWDSKENKAKRILSFSPRPVDLMYRINIWAKYAVDMDMLRYAIFSLFNPEMDIRTDFSDYTKAFLESEDDVGEHEASDGTDRILRKSLTIKVETYLPAPKFLYTVNGELEAFNVDVEVFNQSQDLETDNPIETIELRENL